MVKLKKAPRHLFTKHGANRLPAQNLKLLVSKYLVVRKPLHISPYNRTRCWLSFKPRLRCPDDNHSSYPGTTQHSIIAISLADDTVGHRLSRTSSLCAKRGVAPVAMVGLPVVGEAGTEPGCALA